MKKYFIIFIILHSSFLPRFISGQVLHSQNLRLARDSIGFCWNANEMDSFIDWLNKNTEPIDLQSNNLVGAISVHDDYLYAGKFITRCIN